MGFTRVFSGVLHASGDGTRTTHQAQHHQPATLFALGRNTTRRCSPRQHLMVAHIARSSPHVSAITDAAVRALTACSLCSRALRRHRHRSPECRECPIALYIMMGDALVPVASVPAEVSARSLGSQGTWPNALPRVAWARFVSRRLGGVLRIGIIDGTLSPPIRATGHQARPMLRVAVEAGQECATRSSMPDCECYPG